MYIGQIFSNLRSLFSEAACAIAFLVLDAVDTLCSEQAVIMSATTAFAIACDLSM